MRLLPVQYRFNLPDRVTGERPNPLIIPGGFFVDNSESTVYHSLQTSLRKRFTRSLSFDAHYTYGKALSFSGGDVGVYYGTDVNENVLSGPNGNRSSTQFGRITGAGGMRAMQIGLRFQF